MREAAEHWHLDRRVPIALILTIALQSASAIWWASSISHRVSQVETTQRTASGRAERVEGALADQGQRLAVLTEAVANTNRNLERLQGEIASTNSLLREMLANRYRGGME